MPSKRALIFLACVVSASSITTFATPARGADVDGFVTTFDVKPERFAADGKNDFFVLQPGYQLTLEGNVSGRPMRLLVTVLDATKTIDNVPTRVVERREIVDGQTVNVARDFLAIDKETNDVYRFGREVDVYERDKGARLGSRWESGKDDARFGLLMPAKPQEGQKFLQANARKVSTDRLEILGVNVRGEVPAGVFEKCVKARLTAATGAGYARESSPRVQVFAPAVGLIVDGDLKLVKRSKKADPPIDPRDTDAAAKQPVVPIKLAREAMALVGADPAAEVLWEQAINDPKLTKNQRQDLIEDLNEEGFADPKKLTTADIPLIANRLELIERMAPQAMDDANLDAFNEAHKDLTKMLEKLTR